MNPEHVWSEQVSCLSDGMFLKYLSVGSDIFKTISSIEKLNWKVLLSYDPGALLEQRPVAANYFAKHTIAGRQAFVA